jgi:replicative DNA helicase
VSRRPPTLTESERAALGSALRDPGLAEVLGAELNVEDFSSPQHQQVFSALKSIGDDGLAVSLVSVQDRSGVSRDDLDRIVAAGVGVSPSQFNTLVVDLRRVSGLRIIQKACQNTAGMVGSEAKLEEVMEGLERELYRLDRNGATEAVDGTTAMSRVIDSFLSRHAGNAEPYLSTGLQELDRAILGLRKGKMMVVAARPGMGKTALAGTLRRSVLSQGAGVIEFNLEMTAEELCERELACRAQLNLRKILAAKEVDQDELQRVFGVRDGLGADLLSRWHIDDSTYSIAGIRRRARIIAGRMARAGVPLGLVILDYIQLAGDNGDGREQSVAAISRGCKLMAKELGCTVLALSQLNRACEARDDRRPLTSDLRESGSIEQDADIIAFVYREHLYDSNVPPEDTELLIRKQRSGPTGVVRLHYNAKLVTFEDLRGPSVLTETVQDP